MTTGSPRRVATETFGRLPTGEVVTLITLQNTRGLRARILDYGGIVVSIHAPDRRGDFGDVVLGFDDLAGYLARSPFFGAIVGRYANRIARGRFSLDGVSYTLATNNGPHHLHGGLRGWDKVLWAAEPFEEPGSAGVRLAYVSPNGEEGYPGTVSAEVVYRLTDDNVFRVDCHATSDAPTIVNVTQHTYFNLAGTGDVLAHRLTLRADRYTPVDATLIPTGELAPVAGTPFDFRQPSPMGARIEADDPQLHYGEGYDHNFVVSRTGPGLVPAAHVHDPHSGRTLDVATTQPGVQFYTGNTLGTIRGKAGHLYGPRAGFCLETQHFPDSPNQPAFPSPVLRRGERYQWTTDYTLGVAD